MGPVCLTLAIDVHVVTDVGDAGVNEAQPLIQSRRVGVVVRDTQAHETDVPLDAQALCSLDERASDPLVPGIRYHVKVVHLNTTGKAVGYISLVRAFPSDNADPNRSTRRGD